MKVSIVINNFNYASFIEEAIESALGQTYSDVEVIVIDDGSTDDSKEVLSKYGSCGSVTIIYKQNGGQLSCFNEARKFVKGDLIFFLDSDDLYFPGYVETIVNIYEKNSDVNFVFCGHERFFVDGQKEVVDGGFKNGVLGFSVLSSRYRREWVGSVTSTISMRRRLFDRLLPLPYEYEWVTRADDCLIWGASMMGALKYYLDRPLVGYRVHDNNQFFGKSYSSSYFFKRELAINKLFNFILHETDNGALNDRLLVMEFKSRKLFRFAMFFMYLRIGVDLKSSFFPKGALLLKLCLAFVAGSVSKNR